MSLCPYCQSRPLLTHKRAKTCGDKNCRRKNSNLNEVKNRKKPERKSKIKAYKKTQKYRKSRKREKAGWPTASTDFAHFCPNYCIFGPVSCSLKGATVKKSTVAPLTAPATPIPKE